jgi:hypothetical protein
MVARGYVDARAGGDQHGREAARRVDYVWVHSDSGLDVGAHGAVTGERFALPGHPERELSDHHPLWARFETDRA